MTPNVVSIAKDPSKFSTVEVTAFGQDCEYTGVWHDNEDPKSREAWLKRRGDFLTASDVAAVMGENPNYSALEVFVDKTTERGPKAEPGPDSGMFWGNVFEQPILRAAARWYGWHHRRGGFLLKSRSVPDLACTLDGEIDCHDGDGWIVYEGKTTKIPKGWNSEEESMPEWILIQSQVQLLVTKAPRNLVYCVLQGNRECKIPVKPSKELHSIITDYAGWFMDLVRRRVPPPPDGSKGARTALGRLYPTGDGSAVNLPEEAVEWTKEYQMLSERIRVDEKRRELIKNLICSHIGTATHGLLPEEIGGKACWRLQANKGADTRTLLAMKNAPKGLPILPGPAQSEIELALEESLTEENTERALVKRKRRKAKR